MNTSDFRKTLISIAEGDGSNLLSKVIAYYYPSLDFSSRENLFESLLNRLKLLNEDSSFDFEKLKTEIESDEQIINLKEYKGKDFRIKEIEISNLRGIPQVDEDNPIPYGIGLLDDDGEINNAIILANNGVGKSSVFAGLEMIYAQEIGEKKLRTFNPDSLKHEGYNKYLKNVNNEAKPICKVKTVDGDYSLENVILKNKEVLNLLNPQSHFISEYDVIRNGQITYYGNKENTIHNIVAESLGLSEYLNCLEIAEQIPKYRRSKETTAKNRISKEIESNKTLIKNNIAVIENRDLQLKELKEQGKTQNTPLKSSELNILNELIIKTPKSLIDNINVTESIKQFNILFEQYSSIETSKMASIERQFLEAGNNLLHDFDDCPYCKNSNLTLEEMKIQVESRLLELNKMSKLNKEITESYKKTIGELLNTFQNFRNVYNFIEIDRTEINSILSSKQALETEEHLYIILAPIVNDEKLINHIKDLSERTLLTDDDFNKLANLLKNNSSLFGDFLDNTKKQISDLFKIRTEALENEIESLSNNASLPLEQTILNLEKEIKELEEQIKTATENNETLKQDEEKAIELVEFVFQIKNEIEVFNTKLRVKVNSIVETNFKAFKEPLEKILNDYFQDDPNLKLNIDLKETPYEIDGETLYSKIIVAEIMDKTNPDRVTTPDQYFNTFRYKLFSLMVGLSIALASRKKYKVNIPLVIDDLFYGSDFVSKNTFSKFIQDLVILYYAHTPDMPLQIILFTHDNFIYKNAIEGISYLPEGHKEIYLENTIKSRMFPPKDKVEEKSKTGFKYWNLINN
ncbi:hypothetical protein [Cochleicola gelatinilyticus]|uniref:Uncharacterized protein n=1 Tax=Cochleicola gelatinilyticus TaxID=1763537 RepID=A0A167EM63_9FLAO|nr:hypothetical protein [Cochleicola gelatinilyticus]OAB75673.1 hypothetical protein ULVI_14425 [Cochleicola gelatinilyticus]